MENYFKTINEYSNIEIIEKKSRFIANVSPISNEEEALQFLENIKKQHYNAKHNCFAFVVQKPNYPSIIRFSDDGEPSGTAGKPILDLLLGEELENLIVVVTRYFGGTLLGTGGLVRAYGKAAKEGVLSAKIIEMENFSLVNIVVDYSLIGKIQYEISNNGHILIDTEYTDLVKFSIYVKYDVVDKFIEHILNLTNTLATITKGDNTFLKVIDGKVFI